jgi:hypothetical protein
MTGCNKDGLGGNGLYGLHGLDGHDYEIGHDVRRCGWFFDLV